jgi:hypothetical protein
LDELAGRDQLGRRLQGEEQRRHPEGDERDGEDPARRAERVHLGEAHRGQGDDRHVQRVQQAPALEQAVAGHPVGDGHHQQHQRQPEAGQQPQTGRPEEPVT